MSADPIIYCLETLTDYRQFERLCSDIMAGSGYPTIEPIGGTGDRGRDALHHSQDGSHKTVFAYTVRGDWRVKLHSDCKRIAEEKHEPDTVMYVCTRSLSGDDRDKERAWVKQTYGWDLEVYDLERLRVALIGPLQHLVAHHPGIFCPPFFPQRGGLPISKAADTLIIDHVPADHAFAMWLSRRLALAGYRTWCYGSAPLAGEDADSSVRSLLDNRCAQYLPIMSPEAHADPILMARIAVAASTAGRALPCLARGELGPAQRGILQTAPALFTQSWAKGLDDVLAALRSRGIAPSLEEGQGAAIALRAYMPEPLTKPEPQDVYANVFHVQVPKSLIISEPTRVLDDLDQQELRKSWAFVIAREDMIVSFDYPPKDAPVRKQKRFAEFAWDSYRSKGYKAGVRTDSIIKQLIRQSLEIACHRRGLPYCPDRHVFHFSDEEDVKERIKFTHVDGERSHVTMVGERQWGYGDRATRFRYQLGPRFKVTIDVDDVCWVTTRIYVRVTEMDGTPFEDKKIGPRRKKVTKSWWNKQWFIRTIAMMQALREDPESDTIDIGAGKRKISVNVAPLHWKCPVAIDVEAVDKIGDLHEELANSRYLETGDAEDAEETAP